jgi:hypothetical protein
VTSSPKQTETTEITGIYGDRAGFERGVAQLLAAGFDKTDLSVLASHDSLAITGTIPGYRVDTAVDTAEAIDTQLPWLGPLAIADLLVATTGPVGIAIAAAVAAAAGAVALRPILSELAEQRHAEGFAQAVASGNIVVWVRASDAAAQAKANAVLAETGARDVAPVLRRH